MNNQYNLSQFEAPFREFLISQNVAPVTIKNYLSDLRHFFGWLIQEFRIQNFPLRPSDFEGRVEFRIEIIDSNSIIKYCENLSQNKTPLKTVNRRLSTLRKFFSFCISQGWITHNPAKKVTNITTEKAHSNNLILTTEIIEKSQLSEKELLIQYSGFLKTNKLNEKETSQIVNDLKEFFTIINFSRRENQL